MSGRGKSRVKQGQSGGKGQHDPGTFGLICRSPRGDGSVLNCRGRAGFRQEVDFNEPSQMRGVRAGDAARRAIVRCRRPRAMALLPCDQAGYNSQGRQRQARRPMVPGRDCPGRDELRFQSGQVGWLGPALQHVRQGRPVATRRRVLGQGRSVGGALGQAGDGQGQQPIAVFRDALGQRRGERRRGRQGGLRGDRGLRGRLPPQRGGQCRRGRLPGRHVERGAHDRRQPQTGLARGRPRGQGAFAELRAGAVAEAGPPPEDDGCSTSRRGARFRSGPGRTATRTRATRT